MDISEELRQLHDLYRSGALTAEEFEAAKAAVLSGGSAQPAMTADVQQQLERIRLENEMLRLDQDWSSQRERYMMRGQQGRFIPTRRGSIVSGILVGLTMIFLLWYFATPLHRALCSSPC